MSKFSHILFVMMLGSSMTMLASYRYTFTYRMEECRQKTWDEFKSSPGVDVVNAFYGFPKDTKPNYNAVQAYNEHVYMQCLLIGE